MYEDRIAKAVENFGKGYNCAQAVVAAFSDLYGLDEKMAKRIASSFGGGIGRMRMTCGAACGMFMLAGLESFPDDGGAEVKVQSYDAVQQLAARFKEENGSLICAELLGLVPGKTPVKPKRPCRLMVETASRIFADYISEKK